ncbi:MAG: single-stranded DNA-binding protein [Odoribacter sp.]|nr:single-stranded DNA-binding protein [Odoribacter sp.]
MNKVILSGYVGSDPAIRYIDTRPIAEFSLATRDAARTSSDGKPVPERTDWHRLVLWDSNAEFAEKYIRKGSRLIVEGSLRSRVWEDRATQKHTVVEVYVSKFEILPR